MLGELLVAVSLAMSPGQCTTCGPGGGMEFSPGMAAGSWTAGSGGFSNPYDSVGAGGGGGGDQLYPYDSPEPWLHGYFQEFPAYSGYHTFRPHNYKHVLAQMDVASRWGMSPQMAYSHQWAHRYRQRSGMHPNFGSKAASLDQPDYGNYAQVDPAQMNGSIGAPQQFPTQQTQLQQAAAIERGYTGTPIPGSRLPSISFPETCVRIRSRRCRKSTSAGSSRCRSSLKSRRFRCRFYSSSFRTNRSFRTGNSRIICSSRISLRRLSNRWLLVAIRNSLPLRAAPFSNLLC